MSYWNKNSSPIKPIITHKLSVLWTITLRLIKMCSNGTVFFGTNGVWLNNEIGARGNLGITDSRIVFRIK